VISKYGFVDCGLVLGILTDMTFKEICQDLHQRESLVVSCLPLQRQRCAVIHPPARHLDMVRRLYERLALPFQVEDPAVAQGAETDQGELVKTAKSQSANSAEIRASSCGDEAFSLTRSQWKRYCQERTDAIFLYVNLEDPRCPGFAARCEGLGFFFGGVQPGAANGHDALILQYLNNVKIDYDCLKLYSAEAQELARYIRALDPNAA
jgi:serine/threonine-protein kinase RsbW